MQLILLLVLFGVIGYMLAGSDFRDRVDRTADRVTTASGSWWTRSRAWWRARFSPGVSGEEFRAWVAGRGADSLPDEFREWCADLSRGEAQEFTRSLADYADGLGYNLALLVAGRLEQKPVMKQVFVEAIVVYSDAYRKAKTTHQQESEGPSQKEKADEDNLRPAQKSASRRKRKVSAEATEAASAA